MFRSRIPVPFHHHSGLAEGKDFGMKRVQAVGEGIQIGQVFRVGQMRRKLSELGIVGVTFPVEVQRREMSGRPFVRLAAARGNQGGCRCGDLPWVGGRGGPSHPASGGAADVSSGPSRRSHSRRPGSKGSARSGTGEVAPVRKSVRGLVQPDLLGDGSLAVGEGPAVGMADHRLPL